MSTRACASHRHSKMTPAATASFSALATCSSSSSTSRSHPLRGYRPRDCAFIISASLTLRSFFYKARRNWCSSNILLKLRECFVQEVRVCDMARLPYRTTSVLTCSTSRSSHAFPKARAKATRPSSHTMIAPSLLFSSSTTADIAFVAGEGGEVLPTQIHQTMMFSIASRSKSNNHQRSTESYLSTTET
jgi:hypothetical protein